MRFHTQTAGVSLTAQQPEVNIVRTAIEALAAVLGGTQSLHTNSFDEALALPTEDAVAARAAHPAGDRARDRRRRHVDPLGGSYFLEAADRRARAAGVRRTSTGSTSSAASSRRSRQNFFQREIAEAAFRYQREVETGERVIVGVNRYARGRRGAADILQLDPALEGQQIERVRALAARRDSPRPRPRSRELSAPPRDRRQPDAADHRRGARRRDDGRDVRRAARGLGHLARDAVLLSPGRARSVRSGSIGLGTMGAGIAQVCVQAGIPTVGREMTAELGERARAGIDRQLARGVERERLTERREDDEALALLELTTELGALSGCDLVIEAIVEELGPKQHLFGELDGIVGDGCILATNTSALSVTEIASATARPERVVGLHFFNPAPVLQLVEVVKGELSSAGTVDAAFAFAQRIGKQPIRARDTPGFVVNRILIPTLIDAVRVLEEGTASAEDIDAGMKLGTGWPIGPLALIDLIGVDVTVHAAEAMAEAYGDPRFKPTETLSRMLEAGQLGRKSGRGFYSYDEGA